MTRSMCDFLQIEGEMLYSVHMKNNKHHLLNSLFRSFLIIRNVKIIDSVPKRLMNYSLDYSMPRDADKFSCFYLQATFLKGKFNFQKIWIENIAFFACKIGFSTHFLNEISKMISFPIKFFKFFKI